MCNRLGEEDFLTLRTVNLTSSSCSSFPRLFETDRKQAHRTKNVGPKCPIVQYQNYFLTVKRNKKLSKIKMKKMLLREKYDE